MEKWRLIDDQGIFEAAKNLSIEEAIFVNKIVNDTPTTVRFWRNKKTTIVGYSQTVRAEVNLDVCKREKIEVVRRFSGGGTVYQDLGTLNYTVVISHSHPLISGLDVEQSLKILCKGIITSLKILGVDPIFKPPSNILINNKKVSGNAQARRKNVILQHGTLLVNTNLNSLNEVLNVPNYYGTIKGVMSKRSPVTNLSDELKTQTPIETVRKALRQGFERSFSIRLVEDDLSEAERRLAEELYEEKYSKKEWTFWR
ncbi:lipoate--protein ligase family protein [Candidatus Bathyarchaeota archaeon]|nr:lipoate--protein ligase family protein [Candidatus Bathyarchaeota archaeon]